MVGTTFTNLFGKSPIKPIQQHMAKAHECASHLSTFFSAAQSGDWLLAEQARDQITELEREADQLKKQLRLNLPKSLFLPVPRSDLLDLVTMQDKIANGAKDISGLMLGRRIQFPASMAAPMSEYLAEALATSAQALKAIQEMDELLETGFRGHEVDIVQALIEELDRLEHNNDKLQIEVRAKLFALERDLPPVDVMFLYKIIDRIGDLADRAQKVGSRLQLLIAG